MAKIRSVDFLPEIFQTPVNTQFLNATLDQLIQEPNFIQSQGYIGQKVGPGVNPNDKYVIEPTADRNNYQLEPGVVTLSPVTGEVEDAITYPGILDGLKLQGAVTNKADRLFESEYYTWDPFVDFDKFNNYFQYYWLPNGPAAVTVSATAIPSQATITVTRENGVYKFSGYQGNDPTLTLVRQGSYQFKIAQNQASAIDFRVTNNGTSSWNIDYQPNPTLTLVRGDTYTWNLQQTGPYDFYIKTQLSFGTTNLYNKGVTNNGANQGLITFTVPQDAPDTLYYCNDLEFNFRGTMNIIDASPGTGPNFWIQAEPGVNGRLAWSPNISSRDVLGVNNNGIDLGTVTFNVPAKSAQDFYYNMPTIGKVDLIPPTDLLFNEINGVAVDVFFAENPTGIDGITDLNGRTLVFTTQITDPTDGGWLIESGFDPLLAGSANNGQPGSFDSLPYDDTTYITTQSQQYSVWQIQYVPDANGILFMQLNSVLTVDNLTQFTVDYGKEYVNTNWYKNSQGFYQQMPLLTATLDTLYYQDGINPAMFGSIKLIEEDLSQTINVVSDILGQKNYTSPNGVVFTNGLKITFSGSVIPSTYTDNTYYVQGVGTAIKLCPFVDYVTPESYDQQLALPYDSTPYDSGGYSSTTNEPLVPEYITISMASPDLNPWTRGNRWFHTDVIQATAKYNNTAPLYVNALRAKRPILEFHPGLKLFNYGTQGIAPVSIVDLTTTDAMATVNGAPSYGIDGYSLQQDSLVIFAADTDPVVRSNIYKVSFVVVDPSISTVPIIDLIPTSYSPAVANQTTICLDGGTLQGIGFWFDGVNWIQGQQKTQNNQAPLFDVYSASGYSFGNTAIYPSTNFAGSKLLSYAENPDNPVDTILGIPLAFFSIDNVGNTLFDNNLYTDTFSYTPAGGSGGVTTNVSEGFVRQYADRTIFDLRIGWETAVIPSFARQQFQFTYSNAPLQLDILISTTLEVTPVQIYVNSVYQLPGTFTLGVNANTNTSTITLNNPGLVTGDIVEVLVYSDEESAQGFYQIPVNLENNPLNGNSPRFSLGTVRQHYASICENLPTFNGVVNGPNNTRDLGNIGIYGRLILQQSSPLTLGGYFLRSTNFNVFNAIAYNSREYIKYKSKLLTAVTQLNIQPGQTVASILDAAVLSITNSLTSSDPFYWSDMLPTGINFTSTTTVVNPITTNTFNLTQTYDFTQSNYLGLLVYVNNILLIRNIDYVVSTDAPKLTISITLNVGDVVTINEYPTTVPSWCPNTPSKMGLYPKYTPAVYLDETYSEPTIVIRGHDGSKTIAFGDIRDQVLFEFEKRIYDNIKVDDNPIPLSTDTVDPLFYPAQTTALLPGFFRKTPYTWQETNQILSESFLSWVGQNKVNYTPQNFVEDNPFTYNYKQAGNRITETPFLQGNWRGIYRYFYDTETPNLTPWEMLGFSEVPVWWELRYGPAPYTSGNQVLWDDLEAGIVADPLAPYILPEYIRPGLSQVLPVDSEGVLLPPLESVIGFYDPYGFQASWTAGDGGPVESSWWNSSNYPFAVMRLLALTKPAQFFSLFADRDLYRYDTTIGQYLYNKRYRLNANTIEIYGNGVSKASYINWIVDYNRQLGFDSTTELKADLENIDVRLCYRMAAFSDPAYLNIYTERAGPSSTNNSLWIPPSSYNVLFYKNQPFKQITYSSLIVQIDQLATGGQGYSIFGYSNIQPYFEILVSSSAGLLQTVTAGGLSVQVPAQYTNNVAQIPYGYLFTSTTEVVDFILSYGAYLESQGLVFDNVENGYTLNWRQMAQEFLYYAAQGWTPGTMINLNPSATTIKATQPISIVDTIASTSPENMLLDQNRQALDVSQMIVNRNGNEFSVTTTNGQTINYLTLAFTNYEDTIIFDNTSQYNDLIYDPITAARQIRLNLIAALTAEWDGQLNAQGFILNLNNVKEWAKNTAYTKGEIVLYKNTYWQSTDIVKPQEEFNYNDWIKSNYQLIDQGLLPNLATKSDQQAEMYDVYRTNLNRDYDLFAFALIGFKPRQYMSQMNLSEVTQVQLYQQFIGTKGTTRAAEIFGQANLGKESGAYQIYENWGILAGTYGAQANKAFFEIQLNEALLQFNPSTIQITLPGETSIANQQVYVSNLWKESYPITSPDILPVTYENSSLPSALPSAGYVNLNDVDITVFNIDEPTSIGANIDNIGIGTYIWIAKINNYNWGVYRVAKTVGQMTSLADNLNGTSIATFNNTPGLAVGDLIIIKYFNPGVNGVYRVLALPTPTTITIAFTFTNSNVTTVTGTGIVFKLQSARVAQASDVATLPYVNDLIPGGKAWVDNDGDGRWATLQKKSAFTVSLTLDPGITADGRYGVALDQAKNTLGAIVGAPGYDSGTGALLCYYKSQTSDYQFNTYLYLGATDTVGYGEAVSFGGNTLAAIGAPQSNSGAGYAAIVFLDPRSLEFTTTQILVEPNEDFSAINFGAAVTISQDERWMYIGAPESNTVYAYTKIDVVAQNISYVTDGTQTSFNYSSVIQVNGAEQLSVNLGTKTATLGIDYTVNSTSVVFFTEPGPGQTLVIARRQQTQLDAVIYYGIQQNTTSGVGLGAVFEINNVRGAYYTTISTAGLGYAVGNTVTINGTQLGGATPANNLVLTITEVDSFGSIVNFTSTGSGITNTAIFDIGISLYNVTNIYSFTITVDNALQRPFLDYTYDEGTTTVTFVNVPAGGTDIQVFTGNFWQFVDTITTSSTSGDMFGSSIVTSSDGRSIVIGAPMRNATGALTQSGEAYIFDRSVLRYIVSDVTQMSYTVPGTVTDPVIVSVNNQFLLTTDQSVTGQYSVSGNTVTFTNITFTLGDIIEIETNQFQLIQSLISHTPSFQAQFATTLSISPYDSAVYIGCPFDSTYVAQAGSVDYQVNQSRKYGVITSTIANPTLTVGSTIRINNTEVTTTGSTVADLAEVINAAAIPNVIATTTSDLTFIGDGSTKVYNIGSLYADAASYTTVVYRNNTLLNNGTEYSYNPVTQDIYFVYAPNPGDVILVVSGRITFSIRNAAAGEPDNLITVLPGVVTPDVFYELGLFTFVFTQQILSPAPAVYAQFGAAMDIDSPDEEYLMVGAPNGNIYEPTTFDAGQTFFDEHSTTFYNPVLNAGVVYTFDYFRSSNNSLANPGKFAFGQQIYNDVTQTGDGFGTAVAYHLGKMLVGAPGGTIDNNTNDGYVTVLNNSTDGPSWAAIRTQQPVADVYAINGVFAYNGGQAVGVNETATAGVQTYFDFFDPLQGKILGTARRNIDYIGAVDPAQYNKGTVSNVGDTWASEHIGEMWWDTNTVRFIDPNQNDIVYASRKWGSSFPGSRIDIYQWVESDTAPSGYTGQGAPLSATSYTVSSQLGANNIFQTHYYFWVRDITTVSTGAGKTLSAQGVANYILDPRSSGLPYIAALNANTIAIYNATNLIEAQNTILSVGFDRTPNDAVIHQEYQLIQAGIAKSFLSSTLYRKYLDSFCGADTAGNVVPDPTLSPGMRYGVQFRPRQSMFANRFMALENYLTRANKVCKTMPISETKSFNLLNAAQTTPAPDSGAWNFEVPNLEVLYYQNLAVVPVGYKYLVASDSTQDGRWTIYVVTASKTLQLAQVQSYDTPLYWYYVNWYKPGYNSSVAPVAAVQNYGQLATLSYIVAPIGSSVRVVNNGASKFEIYLRTGLDPARDWERVGLEDGTIQFKEELWNYTVGNFGFDAEVFDAQYFDESPQIETRYIIRALNEEIYVDDLEVERNNSLILMFNYIYSEFTDPSWLIKTSYVDVDHEIRTLLPYQTYLQDNQNFVLDYFQEIKPYHVQTRQFNLIYNGNDEYYGDVTDYDLPAYFNTLVEPNQFTSPILTPYTEAITPNESSLSNTDPDAQIWIYPSIYSQWFNNYLLTFDSVQLVDGGSGYTVQPVVTVTGTSVTPAVVTATINSVGQVISLTLVDPGTGWSTTPIITITGGNGEGAVAIAMMSNSLVRNIKTTIKYDRCEYQSTILTWTAGVTYDAGTQVRYDNRVWQAIDTVTSTAFDPGQWELINAALLSGTDRTMGYYVSTVNTPGLNLPLLIDGIDYPGVEVTGVSFELSTGFDRSPFDVVPFDNISYDAEGRPTYDLGILDTMFESSYLDPYLGTRPTDINIDGGLYVDAFESHAPEELVPGIEFDTLDLRVYTTPGADWFGNGHGFPQRLLRVVYDSTDPTTSFAGLLPYPATLVVTNGSASVDLTLGVDYSIDWVNQTVSILSSTVNVANGNLLEIYVYELGGGNQLYKDYVIGDVVGDSYVIPVEYPLIQELAIFVNGANLAPSEYTLTEVGIQTQIDFTTTYTDADALMIVAIGATTIDGVDYDYSWSLPINQQITSTTGTTVYDLDNSLEYLNSVNTIVYLNASRLRSAAGVVYIGDNAENLFLVPQRQGYDQATIVSADIQVYFDDILQDTSTYTVNPITSGTTVNFSTPPATGVRIYIACTKDVQVVIDPTAATLTFLTLTPVTGSSINVVTWNDTRQLQILTQVWVGPETTGIEVSEGYDTTDYDAATVNNTPGSFNYSTGGTTSVNNFDLGRTFSNIDTLWVTLNGRVLSPNSEYQVSGTELTLSTGVIQPTDVVMCTQTTDSVVPEGMAFRVFQDMRGIQATYRMTPQTTTTVAQAVAADDDIIYVTDASNLSEPNFAANVWGVITIDGERIMYRERDTTANTVSSLLRGTAGTGADSHEVGAYVYDMGRGNLLPQPYQDYVVSNSDMGDGTTTIFTAPDISLVVTGAATWNIATIYVLGAAVVSAGRYYRAKTAVPAGIQISNVEYWQPMATAVEVYVGGTLLTTGTDYVISAQDPVQVTFTTAPADGSEVTMLVRRGVTWYNQGISTASDGVPLQETTTGAARFLQGQ